MGFLLKTTEETYVYEEDAAVVAQTCIDVLGRLGKVTKVERDSGIILGKESSEAGRRVGRDNRWWLNAYSSEDPDQHEEK